MFKSLAKIEKKILRLQNQTKVRSYRNSPKHKFGHKIPRNNDYNDVFRIDEKNNNRKWTECVRADTYQ